MKSFIGIGSNTGNRQGHFKSALRNLTAENGITIIDKSPIYETPPLYNPEQGYFLNGVILISTNLNPIQMLHYLKEIEVKEGREPTQRRNSPRPLDLDILTFGNLEVDIDFLRIPHPKLSERKFVLQPWADIAPDFEIPGKGSTVGDLLKKCKDTSELYIFNTHECSATV